VNRIVRGLRFEPAGPRPPDGVALESGGKKVGVVTSSAFSPGWKSCIGLGVVRVSHAAPGTALSWVDPGDSTSHAAVVCDLPSRPPLESVPVASPDGP
jgi:glycine cleavage system aminomethyltransferase T